MSILTIIITILCIGIVWRYRINNTVKNTERGVEQLNEGRISLQNELLSNMTSLAPVASIKDPLVAAATLMVSIQSEEFVLGDGDEEVIGDLLAALSGVEGVEEAINYAKWAVLQVPDAQLTIDELGNFLKSQLTRSEKIDFLELLDEANRKIAGCRDYESSRMRLASKMGLTVLH